MINYLHKKVLIFHSNGNKLIYVLYKLIYVKLSMTYLEFTKNLKKADITAKEFALMLKKHPNSITNNASKGKVLIGTAMDPFHWRRNGPTPFVP